MLYQIPRLPAGYVRADTRLAKVASDPFTEEQVREDPAPYRAREAT
jgi:hypothetical protein